MEEILDCTKSFSPFDNPRKNTDNELQITLSKPTIINLEKPYGKRKCNDRGIMQATILTNAIRNTTPPR